MTSSLRPMADVGWADPMNRPTVRRRPRSARIIIGNAPRWVRARLRGGQEQTWVEPRFGCPARRVCPSPDPLPVERRRYPAHSAAMPTRAIGSPTGPPSGFPHGPAAGARRVAGGSAGGLEESLVSKRQTPMAARRDGEVPPFGVPPPRRTQDASAGS